MKQYIGTKIIMAEPASRYWLEDGRKVVATRNEMLSKEMMAKVTACDDGYKVRYPDGYESFSPKEVFEEAYRETAGGISFGMAIEAAKLGKKIARKGWNGKGMFLYYVPAAAYQPTTNVAIEAFRGEKVPYGAYMAIKTMQGNVVPWLASQTDMLADDWVILE